MKNTKPKEWLTNAVIILLVLIIIAICISLLLRTYCTAVDHEIFAFGDIYAHPSVEFWVGYSGVILSFISIVMVITTMIWQLRQLKLQKKSLDDSFQIAQSDYNAYVLKLVEIYLSDEMAPCRQVCWLLREELKHNEEKLNDIRKLFIMQIKDEWGTREEYAKLQKTDVFIDYAQFTKLMRFFDMMSHYKITEETAYAIHFYYVWWRSFFIQMIECFMEAFNSLDPSERHMTFPPDWCSLVTRMDEQMNKYNLALV